MSKGVGVVSSEDGCHEIRVVETMSDDEFENAVRTCGSINAVNDNAQISLLERNYKHLTGLRHFYNHNLTDSVLETSTERDAALANLISSIINWLTSARLFHDHGLAQFSRLYGGNESAEWKGLKRKTREEYDRSSSYRILYKLRNYTQHIGFPLSQVQSALIDPDVPDAGRKVLFLVSRDSLIADYYDDWSATVRADLMAMPETIDVLALIDDCMPSWRRIYSHMVSVRVDRARPYVSEMEALVRRTHGFNGIPCLLDVGSPDPETGEINVGQRRIPIELARALLDEEVVAETIRKFSSGSYVSDTPSPLDLSETDKILTSMSVALMGIFYEEGTSDYFDSVVYEYAKQYDSLRPIVYGLVRLNAISLFLASSVLGGSERSILGGIVSQHGPQQSGRSGGSD